MQYAMTALLIASTTGTLFGQQVHIVGNVTKHTFLRAAVSRNVQVVEDETTGILSLHLRPADGAVVIPLIARSNTAYRLTVQGSERVEVRVTAVKPFAGAGHLMPGATNALLTGPVAVTRLRQTILEGSRISNGGNNSTPDNALSIDLEINAHDKDAELILSMEPGAR